MPAIFKAMATITVWIFFVFGCLSILGGFVRIACSSMGLLNRHSSELLIIVYFGLGITSLALSMAAIMTRKKLE
jgi:hypothetical protein